MKVSDLKKIKDLEDENRRFKQMFADLNLEESGSERRYRKKL
ncbi:transposase A [Escherichia coli M605]|uniref:Transposase A n=1 Tax=Escherichia coli M605 TaxID=656417 RepID=F4SY62_ECOLX|nr:transposase A [Escherichia coli M605]